MKPFLNSHLTVLCLKPFLNISLPKVHSKWPHLSHTQPSPQDSPEGLATFLFPCTHPERRKMFSLFAPQCCFQNTVLLSSFSRVASTEAPTIHSLPFPGPRILSHLNLSRLLSIALHHFSKVMVLEAQCLCSPDILMLKTLLQADCYAYLKCLFSTPWPLWANLGPKQQAEWPHLQNPKFRVSLSPNHNLLTSFLLDIP